MRFGLVGTGHWARVTHAPALAAAEGAALAGVWGRDSSRALALADDFGARAHAEYEALLDAVDAVAFAVPPHVQCELAIRAANAGKHLLLEKPIALDDDSGRELETAVRRAGVASVVFFTQLFRPEVRAWLSACASAEFAWEGGSALVLGSVQRESGPFSTPWRLEHGGLWDLGPHAVSALVVALGPVTSVAAHGDPVGTVHLVLGHVDGASSVATVSQAVPAAAAAWQVRLWGGEGHSTLPDAQTPVTEALGTAIAELTAAAGSAAPEHPYDVTFGRANLETLSQARRQLG